MYVCMLLIIVAFQCVPCIRILYFWFVLLVVTDVQEVAVSWIE